MDGDSMSKTIRAFVITIAILVACGLAALVVFNTETYETNSYVVDPDFTKISIQTNTANVSLALSEDGECKLVCYEPEKAGHCVVVEEDTLSIQIVDERKWYEHIGIIMENPKITVYLPDSAYYALTIFEHTGDIDIPGDFSFDSMDISTTTGNINNYACVKESAKLNATTGNISVKGITAGSLYLSVSTGKVTVTDVTCQNFTTYGDTGDVHLKNVVTGEKLLVETDTGDVKFDGCDAAQIFVETDTGDVTGSLLSNKVFITETDTGSIKVPKTTTGGKCEISTDTGDIKISID